MFTFSYDHQMNICDVHCKCADIQNSYLKITGGIIMIKLHYEKAYNNARKREHIYFGLPLKKAH